MKQIMQDQQLEFAKLDYARLATQEQNLIDKRLNLWLIFFAILSAPSGFAGAIGLRGSIYLFALVPFFITCIALDIKHDEKVLRYDVRKQMRKLAARWDFSNHDSTYTDQDGSRWWHGYYKVGKAAAFVGAEIICSFLVSWTLDTSGQIVLSSVLAGVNLFFTMATLWCMI